MQSVYKLPIAIAVLQQVDAEKLNLKQKVRVEKSDFVRHGQRSPIRDEFPNGTETTIEELIRLSVSESDGTASDILMRLAGGPQTVQDYVRGLGISDMSIANSEKEFARDWKVQFENWSTPDASVALLQALYERKNLSQPSADLLLKFMIESPTGPGRLKGLLPPNAVVAHKTGTSGSRNGITAATNDIGIITLPNGRHIAIAVYVANSPENEPARERTIAQIAKACWDVWK